MTRPRLLDLFCGAGGASTGYHRAGFDVTGVDLNPQPNYPHTFVQADAIHYAAEHWQDFDAIHASPPCQHFSAMSNSRPGLSAEYPDLVAATRGLLQLTGLPWVIENVVGSPLTSASDLFGAHGTFLCGHMFGLPLYRHRLFETSFGIAAPAHPRHQIPASKAGHWEPGAREAIGIDWMTRHDLAESIPPAYTEFIGTQLLDALKEAA
jgi:DNA (cytosine-5)-methyltransferase 1